MPLIYVTDKWLHQGRSNLSSILSPPSSLLCHHLLSIAVCLQLAAADMVVTINAHLDGIFPMVDAGINKALIMATVVCDRLLFQGQPDILNSL